MPMLRAWIGLTIGLVAAGSSLAVESPTAARSTFSSTALLNAEYQLPSPPGGAVHVRDGKWFKEDVEGRQSLTIVDMNLRGDLDGDGIPDAVVLSVYWGGGSGVFTYLAAVLNEHGQPRHVASVELGDRVKIKSVVLKKGRVIARLVVQGDDDPGCCPTVHTKRVFILVNQQLVEVGGA